MGMQIGSGSNSVVESRLPKPLVAGSIPVSRSNPFNRREVDVPGATEVIVKRERMLQVALGLVGLFYVALIYPLYTDLADSKWLLEMKDECEPMFLSFFIALGPFLLLAARKPSLHRSLIAFAA